LSALLQMCWQYTGVSLKQMVIYSRFWHFYERKRET